jgi:osmotically-inducible protein OsmY
MSNLIRINRLKLIAGVSVSLLTVACASTPPESLAEVKADRALADKVQSAIDSDPEFFFQHVDVQAENGTVSLSGYVWSDPAIVRAERIARQVPGVTSVSDQLELERNGSNGSGSGGAR